MFPFSFLSYRTQGSRTPADIFNDIWTRLATVLLLIVRASEASENTFYMQKFGYWGVKNLE